MLTRKTSPKGRQPFSPESIQKTARIRGATEVHSICPYCAVGCSQLVYVKEGTIIDIEGDSSSPINAGKLCPKGANTFQLSTNPHRVKHVMYRAAYKRRSRGRFRGRAGRQTAEPCHQRHVPGRRDHGQRRELPDQKAIGRRVRYRSDRKSGPYLTQRVGARSGRLVW